MSVGTTSRFSDNSCIDGTCVQTSYSVEWWSWAEIKLQLSHSLLGGKPREHSRRGIIHMVCESSYRQWTDALLLFYCTQWCCFRSNNCIINCSMRVATQCCQSQQYFSVFIDILLLRVIILNLTLGLYITCVLSLDYVIYVVSLDKNSESTRGLVKRYRRYDWRHTTMDFHVWTNTLDTHYWTYMRTTGLSYCFHDVMR